MIDFLEFLDLVTGLVDFDYIYTKRLVFCAFTIKFVAL